MVTSLMGMGGAGSVGLPWISNTSTRSTDPLASFYGRSSASGGTDGSSLSPLSRGRYQTLDLLRGAVAGPASLSSRPYKTLDEVGADFSADLSAFGNRFLPFLQSAGLHSGAPVVLQGDGEGHVLEASGHTAAGQVNRFFQQNNPLVGQFMVAAGRGSLLRAAQNPAFQAEYQADPVGAIKNHIDELKESLLSFQMRFDEGELTTGFASPIHPG